MSSSVNKALYLARAAACHQEAEAAVLDNVKDRCLRAAAAWQSMADRITLAEVARRG